mmetsp:Transcript_9225/g.18409  ORF Transcript_9225/g.18409 Transcript_9225/m.18409 type:complete len:196 (+) Transcript_9225:89-676(+)
MLFAGNGGEDGRPAASLERLTPQQIGILALICVLVLFAIVAVVAFLIWACVVLFETYPSIHEHCNSEAPLWMFCIICTSSMVLSLATGGGKDSDGNLGWFGYVFLAVSIALTVWGVAMYIGISSGCQHVFEDKYDSLMLLFRVDLVLLCVQICLMICLVLCGAVLIGWYMATTESGREQDQGRGTYQALGNEDRP